MSAPRIPGCRCHGVVVLLVGAGILVALSMLQGPGEVRRASADEETKARRLVIVDKEGRERIVMSCSGPNGEPEIELQDTHGRRGVSITMTQTGSAMILLPRTEERGGVIEEMPGIALLYDGKSGASLIMSSTGADQEIIMASEIGGGRSIVLRGHDGKSGIALESPARSELRLRIVNSTGEVLTELPTPKEK